MSLIAEDVGVFVLFIKLILVDCLYCGSYFEILRSSLFHYVVKFSLVSKF